MITDQQAEARARYLDWLNGFVHEQTAEIGEHVTEGAVWSSLVPAAEPWSPEDQVR